MTHHKSVMLEECVKIFEGKPIRVFLDGTLGAGGHAAAMLKAHPEIEMYIGIDRDQSSLELAKQNLKEFEGKVVFVHGNFADLDQHLNNLKVSQVDGFFLT